MPSKQKQSTLCVQRVDGLIAREPHLHLAADLEAGIGKLYARLAAAETDPELASGLAAIAQFSLSFSAMLSQAVVRARHKHHPRPTRIRLSLLKQRNLLEMERELAALTRQMGHCGMSVCTFELLNKLARLEHNTIIKPMLAIVRVSASGFLKGALQTVASRHTELLKLGISAPSPGYGVRSAGGRSIDQTRSRPRGQRTQVFGTVERLNPARKCGAARTDAGELVFFSHRVVQDGLASLQEGEPVSLVVRSGPLGLTATAVQARATTPV